MKSWTLDQSLEMSKFIMHLNFVGCRKSARKKTKFQVHRGPKT